ncbi:hypothetical protein R1flu_019856 [Riccia fluitans]|uniref:SBP-type domain-containing protein n=1 Tax=Riccia fluitans TaxID=41844 RepID=A0ABD1ZJW1_9MARC
MDSDGGYQVALDTDTRISPPFLGHQFFPGSRVGDGDGRQASFSSRLCLDSARAASQALGSIEREAYYHSYNGGRMEWDVKAWEWDSVLFLAQPNPQAAQPREQQRTYQSEENGNGRLYESASNAGVTLRPDGPSVSPDHNVSSDPDDTYPSDRRRKHHLGYPDGGYAISDKAQPFFRDGSSPEEDTETLSLKLGGHSYAYSDDPGSRSTKRYRSSSPGPQFPVCQVDDCKADLSHAKDYHRRHKVCEMHAKAGKALVTRLMQRFCQQCSRFHPLTEFDEGKRSCRRRLAGHNRRRRKNQPDPPVAARGYSNGEENGTTKVAGLVGILNILNQLQAVSSVGALSGAMNDRNEALLQYLKRSLSPAGLDVASLSNLIKANGLSTENGNRKPDSNTNGTSHNGSGEAAETLLAALAASAVSTAGTDTLSLLLQNQLAAALLKAADVPAASVGNGNVSRPSVPVSARMPEKDVARSPLSSSTPMAARPREAHLVSSSRSRSNIQQAILKNSVHREEQQRELRAGRISPPAVAQKVFPVLHNSEFRSDANGRLNVNREDDVTTESTSDVEPQASLMNLMEGHEPRHLQEVASRSRPFIDLQLPPPRHLSESSTSGSDQSPSSSSYADWQDRTGRISFKLFDKDPGELPQSLRKEILEWLAHRPSDMESHIRPGCVVLTIFLSMSKSAWGKLEGNLRGSLLRLMDCGDFWSKGRIHVQVERQNALIVDGKIHVNKRRGLYSPRILSVRPLAVVAGQRTEIVIRGSDFQQSGTRIFCAYQGRYIADGREWVDQHQGKELSTQSIVELGRTSTLESENKFSFCGAPGVVGRCFIEVEKLGGGGNAVPVIVADSPVCMEIRALEQEIEKQGAIAADEAKRNGCLEEEVLDQIRVARAVAELEVNNVLNELGWLFQKSQTTSPVVDPHMLLPSRQKRLLAFAVDRDWCAVVKKILDIIFAVALLMGSSEQTLSSLSEIFQEEKSLLHVAVKRKCRPMVELLLAYVPYSGADVTDTTIRDLRESISRRNLRHRSIFTPDMPGPGGLTPLHVAASMEDAEGIIDALTNDPNQIGLDTWSHVENCMRETPLACAAAAGKESYIQLVKDKLARRDGQATIAMPPNTVFGHPSAKAVQRLELPLWAKGGSLQLETPAAATLVRPSRCSQIPAFMRAHRGSLYRPFMVSMVAVAAVCVCVCVVMRGPVTIRFILPPFSWNSVKYGPESIGSRVLALCSEKKHRKQIMCVAPLEFHTDRW